jgi:predicted metal-dependent HD superfamily phosphohydrolase
LDKKAYLGKIASFAEELLVNESACDLCYHNIDHTKRVVENAIYIGKIEGLDEEQMFIVQAIAWFHDLGYSKSYKNHEDESITIAKAFLTELGLAKETILAVENGINATRVPQNPKNKLEEIIADADLFDLGTAEYFDLSEKLFKEWDDCFSTSDPSKHWHFSLQFLKSHRYFTDFGRDVLESRKQENIAILEQRLADNSY